MKIFDVARIVALLLVVGACAGSTTVTNVYYDKIELRSTFMYVASNRDFLIELHGNPSGNPQAAWDDAVTTAIQGSALGKLTTFTTTPSATTDKNYRLVMLFSGDRYTGATPICGDVDSAALKPAAGRVEIQAAFCYRDKALSRVNVSYAKDSASLGAAMSQIVINLFPRYDPTSRPANDDDVIILFP